MHPVVLGTPPSMLWLRITQWLGESESWVRRNLGSLPGVIRESAGNISACIHARTACRKDAVSVKFWLFVR